MWMEAWVREIIGELAKYWDLGLELHKWLLGIRKGGVRCIRRFVLKNSRDLCM